jgi:transcriptional regulator with XRE-family HTH domain
MTSVEEMKAARPADKDAVAGYKEQMLRQLRAYQLRELREATQQTQVEVARRLHVSQNRISALERGDIERTQIETLRKYAEALGGTLRVEVRIDDKSFLVA